MNYFLKDFFEGGFLPFQKKFSIFTEGMIGEKRKRKRERRGGGEECERGKGVP